jgi:HK97 family phage portal protein
MANWFKRIFARARDGEPTQFGGYLGWYPGAFLPADTYLTHDQALSLSAVWACTQYISQSLATAEVKVLDVALNGSREDASRDHVYKLLNLRPNPDTTSVALKEGWISQALVFGDGYIQIRRDAANRPFELYLLPSVSVVPKRIGERIAYEYSPTQAGAAKEVIDGDDIIHLRGPSLYSLLGESIVTRAARTIAIAKAQDEFALSYYVNSTILGGVLKRTGPMDKTAIDALTANFESARKGAAKAHKAILLPTGVEWVPIDTDAEKSQVVEGRQHSVVDICRFFGVPPPLVGDLGRATWANLESLYIQAVRDCLGPWAKRIQEEVEWKAFGDSSTRWVEIDLKPLTRGDAQSRATANQILRRNGVINANEWREDEGLDPIGEEGDLYVIEANMTLLDEDALTPPEPVAPAAPQPTESTDTEEPDTEGEPPPNGKVSVTVNDLVAFYQWNQKRKRKAAP